MYYSYCFRIYVACLNIKKMECNLVGPFFEGMHAFTVLPCFISADEQEDDFPGRVSTFIYPPINKVAAALARPVLFR